MKWLVWFKDLWEINDRTIKKIVRNEINAYGPKCDLNHLNVSKVTYMFDVFRNSPFNGNISRWDVSNVTNMGSMFFESKFNGDISKWNVSKVKNMSSMFSYSSFNGDISGWNVENVQYMKEMFYWSHFNRDISRWNVQNVQYMNKMFLGSPLKGREPWWYLLYPLFGTTHLMWDSLEFKWIDLERKIIYRDKLSRMLRRSYNSKWDGKLPEVFGFTYK